MPRFLVIAVFAIVALDVFTIVDIAVTDKRRIRALNKFLWLIIVVALQVIGVVLWFLLGKDRQDRSGEQRRMAPDDDPTFLRNLERDEAQDERIRRLEQELAELDDDPPRE